MDAKDRYWRDRAAALDPDAYEFVSGQNWSRTVPEGATWYLANAWWVKAGSGYGFLRKCDAGNMLMLPAGTTIATNNTSGYAYICKPELVTADLRYDYPEDLYYERLDRLREMPLRVINVNMPSGQNDPAIRTATFPADFDRALVVSVSSMDIAWTCLVGAQWGMNTLNEISDDHQMRRAEPVLIPFQRSNFDKVSIRGACVVGNSQQSLQGWSAVYYHVLPEGW